MKNIAKALMALGFLGGASTLLQPQDVFAQTGVTVGELRGTIRDKATNEPAIGATVVATSPALQGEQVAITEDGGQYFITSLPPGLYTLTVYYNDATFSRGNVLIQVGKESVVNVTVDSGANTGKPKGEVIEIVGSAPIVDQGSTKTGLTITEDYTRNIPVARTFGGVVNAAPGSTDDFFGPNFSGATSLENTYVIEGINTTDTSNGALSSNLPTEFLQETEVITGGYNAEYGRATGGIVNVVTKGGSNEFHGSVYGYYTPGATIAAAERVVREGQSIDSEQKLDYSYDVGAEIGGPIIKDKLWFHVGFNPSISRTKTRRFISSQVDRDGTPGPDRGADGSPLLETVDERDIISKRDTYYFTAKLSGAINQNNQFQLSFLGNPQDREPILNDLRRPIETSTRNNDQGAYDVSAKYTSKLNDGKTQIDAVAGYHHGYEQQTPLGSLAQRATTVYAYERSLFDFANVEGASNIAECQDGGPNDMYPGIVNCPVSGYTPQGGSFLERRSNDRTSFTASVTQRVKLAGYHTIKAGGDVELSTYDATRGYTGGVYYERDCNRLPNGQCDPTGMDPNAFPGTWFYVQDIRPERPLTPEEIASLSDLDPTNDFTPRNDQSICGGGGTLCSRIGDLTSSTTNRSIALYLSDSWQIRPNFTLNFGLRWEQQSAYVADEIKNTTVPSVIPGYSETFPEKAFTLNDLWAPRLGFIYDPTNEGKAKIYGHYGRFYENMPMRLNVRLYGGEVTEIGLLNASQLTPTDAGFDPNCAVDHDGDTDIAPSIEMCGDRLSLATYGEGLETAAKGLKGQYSQEFVLGTEYELLPDFKVGVNWIHRSMPSVIEDVLSPTNEYLLVNPGQNFDDEAAQMEAEAERLLMSGDPELEAKGELYLTRAATLRRVKTYDKPDRKYDALQFTFNQRPTSKSLINASYTYSRTRGNYPGLFIPETLQDDPNITAQFDQPSLGANRYGLLSLDRTHNLKIDGFYMFDLKKSGLLITGASFRASSGIPHSVLGGETTYGDDEVYILERGSARRGPLTTQFDVHLAYGYPLSKTMKVEVFTRVFNLFNQQEETDADDTWTTDNVLPIVGGDQEDLRHLKTQDSSGFEQNLTPTINKNYGRLNERSAPRSFTFGARLTF